MSIPPHRQVCRSTIALQFSSDSLYIALSYNPQRSHAACFAGKIVIFEVGSRKRLSGVHRAKTQEVTRRAYIALEASGFSGRGRRSQTRMGVQGRFLYASGLTWQSRYNLFRGAALRHLVSVRAVKRFQHSNPSFCFVLPSPILGKIPAPNQKGSITGN